MRAVGLLIVSGSLCLAVCQAAGAEPRARASGVALQETQDSPTPAADAARGLAAMKAAAEAMGGMEALEGIRSVRLKGDVALEGPTGEMKGDSVAEVLYPDRIRSVLNLPMGQLIQVFDGEHAWVRMGSETRELPPAMNEEMKRSVVTSGGIGLVRTAVAGEAEVRAIGSEEVDGRPADVVLWKMDGQEIRVLLDVETHLIAKIAFQAVTPQGPGPIEVVVGDYRDTDGIRLPWKVTGYQNGEQYLTLQATEFAINPRLDASAFTKP